MLDIITSYTTEDCNQLLGEFGELRGIAAEVEGVRTALFALAAPDLDGVISRLAAVAGEIGNEGDVMKQMAQALDKINLCYTSGESKICGYAESGVIKFTPKELKTIDLATIAGMFGR